MAYQPVDIGSTPNDGTGDPLRDAFDKINDNFVELYGSLAGLLDFQGATDASANPNYPAASQGDIYIVSVAGKVGGASGKDVEVGDFYLALADNAGGTEASVGTSWAVLQANITGGIGSGVDVEDEGVAEATGATTLNFTGAGVTAADAGGGVVDITIPGGGGALNLDDLGDVDLTGAATGDVLTKDAGGDWVPADPTGGGGWTEAKWWDQAVDGTAASVECDVTGANEILILGNDLTNSSSVSRAVHVSIDGGSTWYATSGNYDEINTSGVLANNAAFFPHLTTATAARSLAVHIKNNGLNRTVQAFLLPRSIQARFKGSTTAINRVRVLGTIDGTAIVGTLNGGTIQFLTR